MNAVHVLPDRHDLAHGDGEVAIRTAAGAKGSVDIEMHAPIYTLVKFIPGSCRTRPCSVAATGSLADGELPTTMRPHWPAPSSTAVIVALRMPFDETISPGGPAMPRTKQRGNLSATITAVTSVARPLGPACDP